MLAFDDKERARLRALIARADDAMNKAEGTISRAKARIAKAEKAIADLDQKNRYNSLILL